MGTRHGRGKSQGQQGDGGVSILAAPGRCEHGVRRRNFQYSVIEKSGASVSKFYPFEELIAKTDGKWRVLMERQFTEVTQEEWDKLPR